MDKRLIYIYNAHPARLQVLLSTKEENSKEQRKTDAIIKNISGRQICQKWNYKYNETIPYINP